MARQRRGGFRTPELKGTLGTLLRTTLAQAGTIRDAIAREGRSRLDGARASRRRNDAVAELGEVVLELIRKGEIDLDELPEVRELVRQLDELDAGEDVHPDDLPREPVRRRFDDRKVTKDLKSQRRGGEEDGGAGIGDRFRERDGDGTVSASSWAPPKKPAERVWRPPREEQTQPDLPLSSRKRDTQQAKTRELGSKKGGGISFEDEDLAEYMHPDDVPPKPPKDGDS